MQYVVLEGNLVYDRSKDVRVKHLLEGVEQNNAAPTGAQATDDGDDDHKKDPDEIQKKHDAGEKKDEPKKDEDKHDHGGKKD